MPGFFYFRQIVLFLIDFVLFTQNLSFSCPEYVGPIDDSEKSLFGPHLNNIPPHTKARYVPKTNFKRSLKDQNQKIECNNEKQIFSTNSQWHGHH